MKEIKRCKMVWIFLSFMEFRGIPFHLFRKTPGWSQKTYDSSNVDFRILWSHERRFHRSSEFHSFLMVFMENVMRTFFFHWSLSHLCIGSLFLESRRHSVFSVSIRFKRRFCFPFHCFRWNLLSSRWKNERFSKFVFKIGTKY